jgi:cold-inducible RNA-binding protein
MSTKLYVGNLSFDITENDLRDMMAAHGPVNEVSVIMDKVTGRARGFAFVTMNTQEAATAAIAALNGKEFQGRALTVNEARPREERSPAAAAAVTAAVAVAAAIFQPLIHLITATGLCSTETRLLLTTTDLFSTYMNILIENAETLEYLADNGKWTKKPADGTSFPPRTPPLLAAKNEPIGKFNIVRYFSDTEQFINMDHGSGKGDQLGLANSPAGFILRGQMTSFRVSREAARNLFYASLALLLAFSCAAATAPAPVAAVFLGEARGETGFGAGNRHGHSGGGLCDRIHRSGCSDQFRRSPRASFDLLVLPHVPFPAGGVDGCGARLPARRRTNDGAGFARLGIPHLRLQRQISFQTGVPTAHRQQVADRVLVDFAHEDLSKWNRSVEGTSTQTQVEAAAVDGQKALHVIIDNMGRWDVLDGPRLQEPFADGRTLTCFRARGTRDTREMAIEWDEQDGSRWIATIDLGTEWKSYCLPPESFRFWESTAGRGGAGDRLDVRQAARLSVGLARSHNALPGVHHEYWIGNIGTAHSPLAGLPPPDTVNAPQIDTLSPGWKFYPMHGPLQLAAPEGLALVSPVRLQPPDEDGGLPQAMQPRPRGVGFNQERPWRWQPLLEARSPQGRLSRRHGHAVDAFRR